MRHSLTAAAEFVVTYQKWHHKFAAAIASPASIAAAIEPTDRFIVISRFEG